MKLIIPIILLGIFTTESYCQKVYLTREAVVKLTKKLQECQFNERKVEQLSKYVNDLKKEIALREERFQEVVGRLDSIIAVAEEEYSKIESKYDKAIKLIPKRKRKLIEDN